MNAPDRATPSEAAAAIVSLISDAKFRVLALSVTGLLLLWFVAAAVWVAMPVWLLVAAWWYRHARTDDWLVLALAGLPFWWATGLAQYAIPALAGLGVIGAIRAEPLRGRIKDAWESLGLEKWLALGAFLSMIPSVLVVSEPGRIFTYIRTVGLTGVALAGLLVASAWSRKHDARRLLHFLVGFAGVVGLWTLAQVVYKGSIHLPLQRTASLLEWLPGKAGELTSRAVGEAAGIKYENVGGGRLVVRPHAFFIHAVVTGAMSALLGPLIWRRIRHVPVWRAVAAAFFAGLTGIMLVSSLARGAYLGVAITVPLFAVIFWPDIRRVAPKVLAGGLAIAIAVSGIVLLTRGGEARARQSSQLAEGSFVSRAAYYRATLRAIPQHPLFGHGTQRDNVAAPLQVPDGTRILEIPKGTTVSVYGDGSGGHYLLHDLPAEPDRRIHVPSDRTVAAPETGDFRAPDGAHADVLADGGEEAIVSNAERGIIVVRKFPSGRQERIYFSNDAAQQARLISTPDRDPPLGSHSTLLGVGYKYGILGLLAFVALWAYTGLAPLRTLRGGTRPLFDDARALWFGITAFGAQFLIYEYDFDSSSPVIFYLLSGLLIGLSARPARVELSPEPDSPAEPARATSR
ncbi:MAG TPA: O-antigen ligase family protein [Actinomycetota bacterium]|nr:O-antigen ligase family protein [Actinomycetota bacterium]